MTEKKTCVLLTVGSTRFDGLVKAIDDPKVVDILSSKGFRKLYIQIGASDHIPVNLCDVNACSFEADSGRQVHSNGFEVEWFRYTPSLASIMAMSGLIISHAGSGSIFESLHAGASLITVPNESLMDNHQAELAHQLEKMGHVIVATPSTLLETLHHFDEAVLKPYSAPDGKSIALCINTLCDL
eukprot:jgi/Picsp_1/5445/NSC_02804-R1_protein